MFLKILNNVLVPIHRCARRDRCQRAEEPFRFATDIERCVKIIAHPDSIAVSAHGVPVSQILTVRSLLLIKLILTCSEF